ncbi:hypothetical protein KP79_PYT19296 [Mizuhopecten yessoensis]|uniref:Uncharacterized protein n=1 Tax=Mizuhopecten yessoensis TaxID=6573 RepID=A0A210Q9K5_MIZYE|nr:hypothetical protein KP79_PYT19296 [Mizuhopecten yessoensis]
MKSCDEHSNANLGSALSTSMGKRYPPRLSFRSSYEKVPGPLSSIVDPYPVPVIDYHQEKKENVLCTSKLTLFHEYSPFMNSYNIYHIKRKVTSGSGNASATCDTTASIRGSTNILKVLIKIQVK